MIDNKLVSSKAVIAKVIADLDLKEDEIKITDVREWIGEAMEKIGAIQQLEHKVENIPAIDDNGNETGEKRMYFRLGNTFGLSQTDGEQIDKIGLLKNKH